MAGLMDISMVRPLAYDLTLVLRAPPLSYFEGSVDITIQVDQTVPLLLLHASGLSISSACYLPSGMRASCHQASRDVISISTGCELAPGTYRLRLCFGGSVRLNRADGIYACTWRHDPSSWIIGTHFEPGHCRSAFPCFDLPHFKATFSVTIITPDTNVQALSNTEAEFSTTNMDFALSSLDLGGGLLLSRIMRQSLGHYRVTKFRPTPVVATYVMGFWVGCFSAITTRSRTGTPLSCFLPPVAHQAEEGVFARDISVRAYDFFSELFRVPLPLTKLDIICLPRMHGVGMEGFGAVTIMQDYLLVNPGTDFARRRRIARLLCHEISHQWFGDLVTPQSFDELWLKESTARLFEYIAVDALEPTWRVWPNFVTEVTYMAMLADALPTSHAVVQQHNGDLKSIVDSFDVITYGKGASVLRMLCDHLGVDRFVAGIKRFIHTFQFRNASMDDLWAALEAESSDVSVSSLMEPWLTRSGCPALHVDVTETAEVCKLTLSQRALRLGPAVGGLDIVDPAKQRCIPLRLRVGRGSAGCTLNLFVGEAAPLVIDLSPYLSRGNGPAGEDEWFVVNSHHAGYFATVYESAKAWDMAKQGVRGGHMSDVEAVGMVCDLMLASQAALKMVQHQQQKQQTVEAAGATSGGGGSGGGGSGGGGGGAAAAAAAAAASSKTVDNLMGRLEELVGLLKCSDVHHVRQQQQQQQQVASTPAWIVGQLFLWEFKILMLSKEVEQAERRTVEEAAITALGWGAGQQDQQQQRAAIGVAHELLAEVNLGCQLVESQLMMGKGGGGAASAGAYCSCVSSGPPRPAPPPALSEYLVKVKSVRSRMLSVISRLNTTTTGTSPGGGNAAASSYRPPSSSPPSSSASIGDHHHHYHQHACNTSHGTTSGGRVGGSTSHNSKHCVGAVVRHDKPAAAAVMGEAQRGVLME